MDSLPSNRTEFLPDADALAAQIADGSLLALPPDYSLVAMEAVRALIRRKARNLRLLGVPILGLSADLLIGAGCVAEVESSAVSLGEAGLAARFTQAVEKKLIKIKDATCPAIHSALQATEKGVPFMPLRGVLGSDLVSSRSDWKVVENPLGEKDQILLIPATQPDVALFHARWADEAGNVWVGRRRELATVAHASRLAFVTFEEKKLGDMLEDEVLAPGVISSIYVSAVAHAPRGAWPLAVAGLYGIDDTHVSQYAKAAKTRENATARYTPDKCEVWVPTQDGESSFAAVLAASGLPSDKCEVYKINIGGGFGRRSGLHQDYVTQAVRIAKEMPGVPVKMLWSREEDMAQGRYHPIMMCRLTGAFDAQNNLTGIHMRLAGQSILKEVRPAVVEQQKGRDPLVFQGVADAGEHSLCYNYPNLLVDHAMRQNHVPPGVWRGVNINQNAIFLECFMDELAEAAGKDPVEFRRQFMAKHPRNLAALNAVADRIGWTRPAPSGVHRGIAQLKAFNSYVAAACELSVKDSKVKIHRIVASTDCGYAVNPAQIERQVSGSFVYGLSALFMQECTVKDGRIEQSNFHNYQSMRIAQMPKCETIILTPGGEVWGGIGEPTICVAAPAVLNAIYKATGKRYRSVPLKNQGLELV